MNLFRAPAFAASACAALACCPASAALPPEPLQELIGTGADWSLHAQATYIDQYHGSFPAAYDGPNSFTSRAETEHTFSFSLYLGRKLWGGFEVFCDPEVFQGHGLSQTLGIAGFPNGEAVKSGYDSPHLNVSRLFIRKVIGLGGPREKVEEAANQFGGEEDVNRLVLSAGTFSADDFFDDNPYSHDPRTQFMNWAMWESAAWDYPADIVGFTAGAVAEWNMPDSEWRLGVFMEPHEANGLRLDPHVDKAHSEVLQYDRRYTMGGLSGTVRTFLYWSEANMGSYAAAATQAAPEDISLTRAYRSKAGVGVSWDQQLADGLGCFVRLSWNDGHAESFTFTEIDESVAAGLALGGKAWGRSGDTAGVAVAADGISSGHRHYLGEGGTGLILGDGALAYAPEEILEAYYAFQATRWLQLGPDVQYIRNPGYNSARGPVPVFALRAHVEF